MSNMLRKDFYIYLPVYLQNELNAKLEEYSAEEWFPAAWDMYRTHVLSTPKLHMQTPNLFFSQFIKEEPKEVAESEPEVVEALVEEVETTEVVEEENLPSEKTQENKEEFVQDEEEEEIVLEPTHDDLEIKVEEEKDEETTEEDI